MPSYREYPSDRRSLDEFGRTRGGREEQSYRPRDISEEPREHRRWEREEGRDDERRGGKVRENIPDDRGRARGEYKSQGYQSSPYGPIGTFSILFYFNTPYIYFNLFLIISRENVAAPSGRRILQRLEIACSRSS